MDNLPQPVYTAGYIRNYARLVELSADTMVADYVAQETKDLPTLPSTRVDSLPERYRQVAEALPRSFSIAAANARNATPVQYAAISIGVVLAILIGWQSSSIYDDKPAVEQAKTQDSIIIVNPKASKNDIAIHAQNVNESESSFSTENVQNTDLATSGLINVPVESNAVSGNSANLGNALIKKEKSESVAEQIEMAESIGISFNDNPAQEMPISGNNLPIPEELDENITYIERELKLKDLPGESSEGDALALLRLMSSTDLTLTFTRNSWVDIRDATGKRLIRKLGIAGNSQVVKGVAPFQVLLGFGHGVTIEYNGKAVDFSAFQGNTVARFTLEVPLEKEVPSETN